MKSVKVVALLVVGIFLLTGCGSQKLTCTMSEEEDGLLTTNEVVMEFDDEKVSQVTMTVDMKITEEVSDDEWEASKSFMTGIFEETNENGIQLSTASRRARRTNPFNRKRPSQQEWLFNNHDTKWQHAKYQFGRRILS